MSLTHAFKEYVRLVLVVMHGYWLKQVKEHKCPLKVQIFKSFDGDLTQITITISHMTTHSKTFSKL